MSFRSWMESPRTRLDVVAGVVDGALTALTLSAGRLLEPDGVSIGLALKVGVAASLTNLFVFFVAHYAEMRAELVHTERQLSLVSHGRLVATSLGRQVFRESIAGAGLAAGCSFAGAAMPLLLTAVMPGPRWIGIGLTIAVLGALGALLASSLYGSRLIWAAGIMAGGVALTLVGVDLRIVG